MGVIRHADAGYPEALDEVRASGVHVPMRREREDVDSEDGR
jgi:urocanate hydratase